MVEAAKLKVILFGVIALFAAGIVGFALTRGTDLQLQITEPTGGSVTLKVAGRSVDYEQILVALYSNDFLRGAADVWLLEREGMIRVPDPNLADVLEQSACGSIPAEPLTERLRALRKCADAPANRNLRSLAFDRRGQPFHVVGVELRVSVPEEDARPPRGIASICPRVGLRGRRLEMFNPENLTSIYVDATQTLQCSSVEGVGTQMHLNPSDANELFGYTVRGIETAFAIPAQSGR